MVPFGSTGRQPMTYLRIKVGVADASTYQVDVAFPDYRQRKSAVDAEATIACGTAGLWIDETAEVIHRGPL